MIQDGPFKSAVEASKGAMKYFDDNIEKFKAELAKL